jgi:hypothetical protein
MNRTKAFLILAILSTVSLSNAQGVDVSTGFAPPPPQVPPSAKKTIKIMSSFMDKSTHKLLIETNEQLVSGRPIYVGPSGVPFALAQLVSRTEFAYYYLATAQGAQPVTEKDAVTLEKPKPTELSVAKIMSMDIKQHVTFEPKKRGAVSAIMGDRAMIDKGSVHEVDKLDLYRIYDSSGHYKGLIEVRGVGDFQSQGWLYRTLEDRFWKADPIAVGDTVVFAGQRKPFSIGGLGVLPLKQHQMVEADKGQVLGGGLVLTYTLTDGWGAELLGGIISHTAKGRDATAENVGRWESEQEAKATYYMPLWIKKNFFYPSNISPFLAFGFSAYRAHISSYYLDTPAGQTDQSRRKGAGVAPVIGGGFEFFPGKTFRPRIQVLYLGGRPVHGNLSTFNTEILVYGFGASMQW